MKRKYKWWGTLVKCMIKSISWKKNFQCVTRPQFFFQDSQATYFVRIASVLSLKKIFLYSLCAFGVQTSDARREKRAVRQLLPERTRIAPIKITHAYSTYFFRFQMDTFLNWERGPWFNYVYWRYVQTNWVSFFLFCYNSYIYIIYNCNSRNMSSQFIFLLWVVEILSTIFRRWCERIVKFRLQAKKFMFKIRLHQKILIDCHDNMIITCRRLLGCNKQFTKTKTLYVFRNRCRNFQGSTDC